MADNENSRTPSATDTPSKSTLDDSATSAADIINPANDERSLDIGESGQFAPGGYYNQHGVNKGDRIDLDEFTDTNKTGKI
jgi:hypothetical protein